MTFHNIQQFPKADGAASDRVFPVSAKSRSAGFLPAATLSKPSAFRWLAAVLTDYGVIAVAMGAAYAAFAHAQQNGFDAISDMIAFTVTVLAVFVIGTRQHAILVLGHDGSHGQISRNGRVNDWVANLFAFWPFGIGVSAYRKFHFAHHRYMGTDADPEFFQKKNCAPAYDLPATPRHLIRLAMTALVGEGIGGLVYFIKYLAVRSPLRDKVGPIVTWLAISLVLWQFNVWWVAALWFVALATSFGAVFRLRVWTEHMGTADVHRISARFIYRLIFLPHNTWCHFEHHHFPSVPCWNLPKARALDVEAPISSVESLFASYADYDVIPSGDITAAVTYKEAA